MSEKLSLSEAIDVLEIMDIESLDEAELESIKRRANRRWHPDKIAYTNPSEEKLRRFEANFVKIDAAIETVRDFISGGMSASRKSSSLDEEVTITAEEAAAKYASANQRSLQQAWEKVRATSFEMEVEEVVVANGYTIKELLDEDLADDIPVSALASLWIGLIMYLFVGLIFMVISLIVGETIGSILLVALSLVWLTQAGLSILALIPLSRFWLPDKLRVTVGQVLDQTIIVMTRSEDEPWAVWVFGLPLLLIQATNWLIIIPIYKVVGYLLLKKTMGRITLKTKYYAGMSEEYLEHLMHGDASTFSQEELFDLAHASSRLSAV